MSKFKTALEEHRRKLQEKTEAANARLDEIVSGYRGWMKLQDFMREFDKNCPTVKAMVAAIPSLEIRPHGRYGFIIGKR